MRVLWVRPPLRGLFPTTNTGGEVRNFPVGLAYLNACAKAAGHDSQILDCLSHISDSHAIDSSALHAFEREKLRRFPRPGKRLFHVGATWDRIERAIRRYHPDMVGISCMFSAYHLSALKVAELAKRACPSALVTFGGQHATSLPDLALADRNVDCIVMGEAERVVPLMLNHSLSPRALARLPGVGYRCENRFCDGGCDAKVHATPREWNMHLDDLPFPDPGNLEWSTYAWTSVLITSRGCPLSCTFCSVHDMVGKAFRSRSATNVVDEIDFFVRHRGIRRFNVEDDNFTWDIGRVTAICQEIRKRHLDVELYLPNGITAIKLTPDVIAEMVSAGFKRLFIGLESTDTRTLRRIQKGFTSLTAVEKSVAVFQKHDARITAFASLIIGLPGQTVDDFALDVVRLKRRQLDFFANPYYAVPGSPDRRSLIAAGRISETDDPALIEPWSCQATFEMSPPTVYWTLLAAYALRRRHAFDALVRSIESLVAPNVPATLRTQWPESVVVCPDESADPALRRSAVTGAAGSRSFASTFRVRIPAMQAAEMQFEPFSVWRTPGLYARGHHIAADFMSMVASLATNRSCIMTEAACDIVEGGARWCEFAADGRPLPAEAELVRRAFVAAVQTTAAEERAPEPLEVT